MIDSVDVSPAPKRLGSNAYEAITAAWRDRLAALETQRDLAYSTDADDIIAARPEATAGDPRPSASAVPLQT